MCRGHTRRLSYTYGGGCAHQMSMGLYRFVHMYTWIEGTYTLEYAWDTHQDICEGYPHGKGHNTLRYM